MLWFCHMKDCGHIQGWVIGHDDRISDDNKWVAGWKTLYDHYPYFNGRRIIMHFTGKDLVQAKDEFERKLTITRPIGYPLTRPLRRKLRIIADSSLTREK